MKRFGLFLVPIVFAAPCCAQRGASFGILTADYINKVISTNPPLPMLYYRQGKYKVTVMPAYFTGKNDSPDKGGGQGRIVGDFKGWGGSAGVSYSFRDRWGVYAWGVGNSMSGDFSFGCPGPLQTPSGPGSECVVRQDTRDIKAINMTLSAGVAYQLFGKEDGGFSVPVFLGPTLTRTRITQTYVDTEGPSTVRSDWDMKLEHTIPGVLLGVQAGINVGKYFKINPFLILSQTLGSKCKPYETTALRVDSTGENGDSTPDCGGGMGPGNPGPTTGQSLVETGGSIFTPGINVTYKPWGLSANVTAALIRKKFLSSPPESLEPEVVVFSLSYSFGNYIK